MSSQTQDAPPAWAYAMAAAGYKAPGDDGTVRHGAGSTEGWTLTQLRDPFYAPDWHPEEHPAIPDVVKQGRRPSVYACGFCPRADGSGGPESASLARLSGAYIVHELAYLQSDAVTR